VEIALRTVGRAPSMFRKPIVISTIK